LDYDNKIETKSGKRRKNHRVNREKKKIGTLGFGEK
jgi:hypothetical protein